MDGYSTSVVCVCVADDLTRRRSRPGYTQHSSVTKTKSSIRIMAHVLGWNQNTSMNLKVQMRRKKDPCKNNVVETLTITFEQGNIIRNECTCRIRHCMCLIDEALHCTDDDCSACGCSAKEKLVRQLGDTPCPFEVQHARPARPDRRPG
jgi:hypothetical protein